jgi:hypothetical protein
LTWPYMRGPAYFDSDLALFKNFQITERQKLQFRISAVNFLNHPLSQFGLAGISDNQLNFTKTTQASILGTAIGSDGNECAFLNAAVDGTGYCHPNVTSISPTNTNTNTTGIPKFKTGSRTLTFAVKYYF